MKRAHCNRTLQTWALAALAAAVAACSGSGSGNQTLNVLVTNDDGIAAPGIAALVDQLVQNPNLDITVIAPATNSSGTGDQRTLGPIAVTTAPLTTTAPFTGTSVAGYPADCVIFGIEQALLANPPDLVVSGINHGQNLSGEIIPVSGTVGAAFWAARLGVPAIAVSASIVSPDFTAAAEFTGRVVEKFRTDSAFREDMIATDAPFQGVVLNINYPTCTIGTAVRGAHVVAVGRLSTITGYTLQSESGDVQTWAPTIVSTDFVASDCSSTLDSPLTDVEAWSNGLVAISPLDADLSVSGRNLEQFSFIEKLF